jgi:hypothetical protein
LHSLTVGCNLLHRCSILGLLVWSADRFVGGSATVARHFDMLLASFVLYPGLLVVKSGSG